MKVYCKGLFPCEGRKLNLQHYIDFIKENGHEIVNTVSEADKVLVWSCGFRDDYKIHSIDLIKKIETQYGKEVVVAGCLPDIDPDFLQENFHGKIIRWRDDENGMNQEFGKGVELNQIPFKYAVPKLINDLNQFRKENPDQDASFLDQFNKLYISEGCKLDCSYCSEKRTFPEYYSFPLEDLYQECKKVIDLTQDYNIMLQADSAGDYGIDIGLDFPTLLDKLLSIDPKVKIGIQGLNPLYIIKYFDYMSEFIKSGRSLHLRIPIQSASDKILKNMNRIYTRENIDKIYNFLDEIDFKDYSTDLIVGFPGEEEADFNESLEFVKQHVPTYVNLSKYMESSVIPSYKLSNKVTEDVKSERVKKAHQVFTSLSIYCNTDGGETVKERQRRISKI